MLCPADLFSFSRLFLKSIGFELKTLLLSILKYYSCQISDYPGIRATIGRKFTFNAINIKFPNPVSGSVYLCLLHLRRFINNQDITGFPGPTMPGLIAAFSRNSGLSSRDSENTLTA
jgi:hypothetical protein